jgi:hypothetical protein
VNYAANQGVEWVVLTNGVCWQAHRVSFGKPISNELVFQLDLLSDSPRDTKVKEMAFLLSKEGMTKAAINQFHADKQALSKFNVAAVLRSDEALTVVRRELKRAYPKLSPTVEQIRELIENEVMKREVVEGDRASAAIKAMRKATSRALRTVKQVSIPADVLQKVQASRRPSLMAHRSSEAALIVGQMIEFRNSSSWIRHNKITQQSQLRS